MIGTCLSHLCGRRIRSFRDRARPAETYEIPTHRSRASSNCTRANSPCGSPCAIPHAANTSLGPFALGAATTARRSSSRGFTGPSNAAQLPRAFATWLKADSQRSETQFAIVVYNSSGDVPLSLSSVYLRDLISEVHCHPVRCSLLESACQRCGRADSLASCTLSCQTS
jgi:hypothetical protein